MKTITKDGVDYKVKEQTDWVGDFNADFQPGDYVAQDIVDYFRDVLPPGSMWPGYLQVGEPYSHAPDGAGKYRATYNTFVDVAAGVWKYCGHCFAGETEHRA